MNRKYIVIALAFFSFLFAVSFTFAQTAGQEASTEIINLPFIGEFDVKSVSLPVLSVVLGAVDGFNPCAMWTLLFLITMLLGMENRTRMWILGSTFILASAVVYFIFMAAWLNLFLFLGLIFWVRAIIGIVAIGVGGYHIKEFIVNKNKGCKVTGDEKRRRIFDKIKRITQQKSFWIALGGIIILAFAVNLVELICSLGLPVVFTSTLAISNLPSWQYYLYVIVYIFFFMIDDMIVFIIAMITLQAVGISTKYSRISNIVGGTILLIIGTLLIIRPEWLMFG